jgi:transcriptional regulator GlxA family with amidase domain
MGLHVRNERKVTPDDRFDLLYVPGGIGAGTASKDPAVLDLVRAHHAEGRWVAGNCAGLGVLHRSGILEGREVTSPATLSRRLPQLGTKVMNPRRAWRIDPDSKLFTAGGAGTVHAATIALVWHLFGEQHGRDLAATWDSLPLHGESLFALDGPVMAEDPNILSGVQDAWENTFLPN